MKLTLSIKNSYKNHAPQACLYKTDFIEKACPGNSKQLLTIQILSFLLPLALAIFFLLPKIRNIFSKLGYTNNEFKPIEFFEFKFNFIGFYVLSSGSNKAKFSEFKCEFA